MKPFNSLLGETYELVTSKYRFFSEQVSHHPPVTAFHCESNFFEITSCQGTTARFNGRYISFAPKHRVYINLKLANGKTECYSWTIPVSTIHNLLIGKMYVEVRGKSQIINHSTGETCDMEWKERGWGGKNPHQVVGIVKTSSGEPRFKMQGRFTDTLSIVDLLDQNKFEE